MRANPIVTMVTPKMILSAYRQGYFPMSSGRHGWIDWYSTDPRTVIPLDERFRVRRSLRQALRKFTVEIRINTCFERIIRACSRHGELPDDQVWLSEELIRLYLMLHQNHHAHSVEVWQGAELIGGLYGVAIGGAFFGESMFSRAPYGSQIALVALVERLRARGYRLLDAQMHTEHLCQFGALDISQDEYLGILAEAIQVNCEFAERKKQKKTVRLFERGE